jgi:cell wall-associated NlpC family hydrolase
MFYGKRTVILALPLVFLSYSCASIPKRTISVRESIILNAEALIGTPYKYGGNDRNGFDCSGLVYYLYEKEGITLPRSTEKILMIGKKISLRRLKKGDLIFFKGDKETLHVGIYAGNRTFIHASLKGVVKEEINDYWKNKIITIKRIL